MSSPEPSRHEGRVVLVTGAGSGIGRAAASRLAREGAFVVGCDVDAGRLDEAQTSIQADGGGATMVVADVSSQRDVDRLVGEISEEHGRLDALANVAGVSDGFLPAHEVEDETWNRVMAINVTGPMRLCRAVLPGMMARRHGAIVNVSSAGGFRGGAAGTAYTASKHALIGVTRSIAWAYRSEGIRCNAVCPGAVATNMAATAQPRSEWGFDRLAGVYALLDGLADPDEIAALLSWLISDEASNLNGAIVTSDGGWSAG